MKLRLPMRYGWLLAGACLLIPLLLLDTARLLQSHSLAPFMDPGSEPRSILRAVLVIIAVLNVSQPYLLRRQFLSTPQRQGLVPMGPEQRAFLVGLPFSLAPATYGFILVCVGEPLRIMLYAALLAIAAIIFWTLFSATRQSAEQSE